jgi:hypothetical protein
MLRSPRLAPIATLAGLGFLLIGVACSAPSISSADSFASDKRPAPSAKRESKDKPAGEDDKTPADSTKPTTKGGCTDDPDCGGVGHICVREACITGCRDDNGCSGGKKCLNRKCADPTTLPEETGECKADAECPLGEICLSSMCITGCHTTVDCKIGDVCGTDGLCELDKTGSSSGTSGTSGTTATTCTDDVDCALDKICTANKCVTGCRTDADCSGTKTCSPTKKICK